MSVLVTRARGLLVESNATVVVPCFLVVVVPNCSRCVWTAAASSKAMSAGQANIRGCVYPRRGFGPPKGGCLASQPSPFVPPLVRSLCGQPCVYVLRRRRCRHSLVNLQEPLHGHLSGCRRLAGVDPRCFCVWNTSPLSWSLSGFMVDRFLRIPRVEVRPAEQLLLSSSSSRS